MNANDIKEKGKLVSAWKEMDGSWYEDSYKIYQVGDKYYQIKDHACITGGGTCSYWGKVTEIEKPSYLPTHLCIIIGQSEGRAYIATQFQGTSEDVAEKAAEYLKEEEIDHRGRHRHLSVKIVKLEL